MRYLALAILAILTILVIDQPVIPKTYPGNNCVIHAGGGRVPCEYWRDVPKHIHQLQNSERV